VQQSKSTTNQKKTIINPCGGLCVGTSGIINSVLCNAHTAMVLCLASHHAMALHVAVSMVLRTLCHSIGGGIVSLAMTF